MRRTIITTAIASAAIAGTAFLAPAAQASDGNNYHAENCVAFPFYGGAWFVIQSNYGGQDRFSATEHPPASCTLY